MRLGKTAQLCTHMAWNGRREKDKYLRWVTTEHHQRRSLTTTIASLRSLCLQWADGYVALYVRTTTRVCCVTTRTWPTHARRRRRGVTGPTRRRARSQDHHVRQHRHVSLPRTCPTWRRKRSFTSDVVVHSAVRCGGRYIAPHAVARQCIRCESAFRLVYTAGMLHSFANRDKSCFNSVGPIVE